MRTTLFAMFLLVLIAADATAQNATTALSALRLIPRPDARRLARIEAREGKPTPERWYFLIHDPEGENGLREYVVAGGEIVAMRGLSQFAETLAASDVIGIDALKVDTDKLARVAEQYAEANGAKDVQCNYLLTRDAAGTTPVWTITCLDPTGKRLGEVVFDAAKGEVLSHGGFPKEPGPEKDAARVARTDERPRERKPAEPTPRKAQKVARAEPVATPAEKRGTVQKIGNSLQRLFGGGR
jgi:hypothetical protein